MFAHIKRTRSLLRSQEKNTVHQKKKNAKFSSIQKLKETRFRLCFHRKKMPIVFFWGQNYNYFFLLTNSKVCVLGLWYVGSVYFPNTQIGFTKKREKNNSIELTKNSWNWLYLKKGKNHQITYWKITKWTTNYLAWENEPITLTKKHFCQLGI